MFRHLNLARRWINISTNTHPSPTPRNSSINYSKPAYNTRNKPSPIPRKSTVTAAPKIPSPASQPVPAPREKLSELPAQSTLLYEAAPITDRKADLALMFSALSALIYGGSMINLFMSFKQLPGEIKAAENDQKAQRIKFERGKRWMIIGATLFGSVSVALGAYFMKSRYILQMKLLGAQGQKNSGPVVEVTTTGLWHSKKNVFKVPVDQFRPTGGAGFDQFTRAKYIKFRDYRYPLAYYYMTPTKSQSRDLSLINRLFYRN